MQALCCAYAADTELGWACRGIFITGSSLLGAAIRQPRITSKNLIRCNGLTALEQAV